MKIRLSHILCSGLLSLFTLWGVTGCADEALTPTPPAPTEDGDQPVMLRATMPGTGLATRNGSYDPGPSTPITSRTLLFTFPSAQNGKMKSLPCEFDAQGIGYIYYEDDNGQRKQLRWRDIDTKPDDNAVYLDNLVKYPVQEGDFANSDPLKKYDNFTKMRFGPPTKGYKFPLIEGGKTASAYTEEGDKGGKTCIYKWTVSPDNSPYAQEVDLIWGQIPGRINGTSPGGGVLDGRLDDHIGQPIHFELEHKMSTILFRFYCDETKEEELKKLLAQEKATVFMDRMRVWLEHKQSIGEGEDETEEQDNKRRIPFQRQNGVIDNGGMAIQDGLLLTETLKKEEPTSSGKTYYSTPTWIIPPFRSFTGDRPVLTIQLGEYKFSGQLPQYMQYWSKDGNGEWHLSDRVLLGFKEGYRHTINVQLKMDLGTPDLIFKTVEVSPWGHTFNESSTAGESGIYYWEDLKYVAGLHNENPGEENYKLMRYGTWNAEGSWVFPLWQNIVIPNGESYQLFTHDNFKIERGKHTITQNDTSIDDESLIKTNEQ